MSMFLDSGASWDRLSEIQMDMRDLRTGELGHINSGFAIHQSRAPILVGGNSGGVPYHPDLDALLAARKKK